MTLTYFFFTRCVSAEAATLLAAALDFGLLRILAAFVATALDVTSFFFGMWILLSFVLLLVMRTEIFSLPNA